MRGRPKSGRPTWLDEGELASLRPLVLRGPDPERDGVSAWRAKDLCRIVGERFGVAYSENGMLRLLHDLEPAVAMRRCRKGGTGRTDRGQALPCVALDEHPEGWYGSRCVGEHGTDLGACMVPSGWRSPTRTPTWR